MANRPTFWLPEAQRRLSDPLDRSSLTDRQANAIHKFLSSWRAFSSCKRQVTKEYPAKSTLIGGRRIRQFNGTFHPGPSSAFLSLKACYTLSLALEPCEVVNLAGPNEAFRPFFRKHRNEIEEVIRGVATSQWLDALIDPAIRIERTIKCFTQYEMIDSVLEALKNQDGFLRDAIVAHEQSCAIREQELAESISGGLYKVNSYNGAEPFLPARNKKVKELFEAEEDELIAIYEQCLLNEARQAEINEIVGWDWREGKDNPWPEIGMTKKRARRPGCRTTWGCFCGFDLQDLRLATRIGAFRVPWVRNPKGSNLWLYREKFGANWGEYYEVPGVDFNLGLLTDSASINRVANDKLKALKRRPDCAQYERTLTRFKQRLEKKPFSGLCQAANSVVREAENEVRDAYGVPHIGEGWVSETQLFHELRTCFPSEKIYQHGRPSWLGRQHFDIWFPDRRVAVEYHGIQHFEPIDFFGGENGLRLTQDRDERKVGLAKKHKVKLLVVRYNDSYTLDDLTDFITKHSKR